ncbi:YtzC family protein [Mangrovibacillus cuniculi]|uniref:YtzC family protein n=1 Tax=Mangrovibacillus cuniculi TaxID=2593652 RepID=A0A7S8CC65_9BACI|nr:YtzC family protein [Mangrovibacillus cuniculi]QPC47289.1 YtzC family protein [Mangrovibacillus cuniculi]
MATRKSVEECLQHCEDALRLAQEQFVEANRQEHYHDLEYVEAQGLLETAVNEVLKLTESANWQQKEQLHRMRLQLQSLQNEMILLNHDRPEKFTGGY